MAHLLSVLKTAVRECQEDRVKSKLDIRQLGTRSSFCKLVSVDGNNKPYYIFQTYSLTQNVSVFPANYYRYR